VMHINLSVKPPLKKKRRKSLFLRLLGFAFTAGVFLFLVAAGGAGYFLWVISKDLPDYDKLANYKPPVITRVHAGDGRLIAEFAKERRIPIAHELRGKSFSWDGVEGVFLWPASVAAADGAQAKNDDSLVLRLRYRADVLDSDSAARIFGYYRTALELITADPGARPGRQSLLSGEEIQYQIEGLAGPRRMLPERRFHEIFEEKAAEHPDAVAAVRGEREWTYRELNARANRLARALLARGLRREDVVAVVTERTLDWMAAVLAVFKAGGVYLPIEPHFPADRIAITLSRAGCELVLTEPDSTATLAQALDSLTETSRSIGELADYLQRNPGALVRGRYVPDKDK